MTFAGCCGSGERQSAYPPPTPAPCSSCNANTGPLPPRFAPAPAPGAQPLPPGYSAPPPNQGVYLPPNVRLAPPETVAQQQPRSQPGEVAKLEPPLAVSPAASIPSGSAPLVKNDPQSTPPLPVDIPQFVLVRSRVANGQQPFPDGVAWLQSAGYRTVLHLRLPGEADTAAQRIFEKRGLRYISLEVGPRSLTKDVVEQFNRIIADEPNQPLFVFDRDSSLAGALWYLHFRTVAGMSDDQARIEVAHIGFRNDQDDNSRTMWIAVQNYLRNTNP